MNFDTGSEWLRTKKKIRHTTSSSPSFATFCQKNEKKWKKQITILVINVAFVRKNPDTLAIFVCLNIFCHLFDFCLDLFFLEDVVRRCCNNFGLGCSWILLKTKWSFGKIFQTCATVESKILKNRPRIRNFNCRL